MFSVIIPENCGDCLTECLKALGEDCRPNAVGGQTFSDKCTVRYEVYHFLRTYAAASLRPGSPGPEGAAPGNKRSRLPIIFGVLGAALIVLALLASSICFCFPRFTPKWKFTRTGTFYRPLL
eukprot:Gb_40621 [translate_table: standard]